VFVGAHLHDSDQERENIVSSLTRVRFGELDGISKDVSNSPHQRGLPAYPFRFGNFRDCSVTCGRGFGKGPYADDPCAVKRFFERATEREEKLTVLHSMGSEEARLRPRPHGPGVRVGGQRRAERRRGRGPETSTKS